jgi:hypothetical protein
VQLYSLRSVLLHLLEFVIRRRQELSWGKQGDREVSQFKGTSTRKRSTKEGDQQRRQRVGIDNQRRDRSTYHVRDRFMTSIRQERSIKEVSSTA